METGMQGGEFFRSKFEESIPDLWDIHQTLKRIGGLKIANRLQKIPQRTAQQIGQRHVSIIDAFECREPWLRPTVARRILGCSSFTFSKYANWGFFKREDKRRKGKKRPRYRYNTQSIIKFVQVCVHVGSLMKDGRRRGFDSVLVKGYKNTLEMDWESVPKQIPLPQAAKLMGCSQSSVIRLIQANWGFGEKKANSYRWVVNKYNLMARLRLHSRKK